MPTLTQAPARLDEKISTLAAKYAPLAVEILKEAIRIPADSDDPRCGLSNHELPRLEYLRSMIVRSGAVASPADVGYDDYGNLCWSVLDAADGIPVEEKTVILLDGHTDTVNALRERWHEAIGGGIDPYHGWLDGERVDRAFLRRELGYLPPEKEWEHLVWGRGAADQLAGVVTQIIATKILCELRSEGALRGAIVRSCGTVAEEDNDGGGAMYFYREEWPNATADRIPDVVILTEGTGCAKDGALGIYRGQRGRMQIEVEVTGKSCHGSMPREGRNPLEYGAAIIVEASRRHLLALGFENHPFLGMGTRTASWASLSTPSDCAVPERFTFRFDRRLTAGEEPEQALDDVRGFETVRRAIADGLTVDVRAPLYGEPTWKGYVSGNRQIYPGWVTPEDHPAIESAVEAYRRVATPIITAEDAVAALRKEPRVGRWVFSTDGVGYVTSSFAPPLWKRWVDSGSFRHPAMLGIGPGFEQNTHKIGECVDARELAPAAAVLARFPSVYRSSVKR